VWLRPELGARNEEQQTGQLKKSVYKQTGKDFCRARRAQIPAKTSPDDDIEMGKFSE